MNEIDDSRKVPFGINNYWKMFRAKGFMLPVWYFFQSHLFDLIHKTDTHKWLPKEFIDLKINNFNHCVIYMASWTCEIKKIFKSLFKMYGNAFKDYTFIDIGCGKGKVAMVWSQCCNQTGINQKVIGIDLLDELVEIAKNNNKILGLNAEFFQHDARELNITNYGRKFIIYLYNPFDEVILKELMEKILGCEAIIIYNNPVHSSFFMDNGYKLLFEHQGFHGNLNTLCFQNK